MTQTWSPLQNMAKAMMLDVFSSGSSEQWKHIGQNKTSLVHNCKKSTLLMMWTAVQDVSALGRRAKLTCQEQDFLKTELVTSVKEWMDSWITWVACYYRWKWRESAWKIGVWFQGAHSRNWWPWKGRYTIPDLQPIFVQRMNADIEHFRSELTSVVSN